MTGTPQVSDLASFLVSLARELDASSIMIDGPQGWKAPDNGLEHSRICEGELHTPGKTGLPGETKPANYLPFIEFSIELFDKLAESGYPRLATTGSWPTHVAIESFPTAAWRSIGLAALPSKRKTTDADKEAALQALQSLYTLDVRGDLTHDELQATVAGLACVAH